jgi:hypothetical protein
MNLSPARAEISAPQLSPRAGLEGDPPMRHVVERAAASIQKAPSSRGQRQKYGDHGIAATVAPASLHYRQMDMSDHP